MSNRQIDKKLLTQFRCFAHIVNLTSKAILESAMLRGDGGYDPVKKLRDSISHVSLPPPFFVDL